MSRPFSTESAFRAIAHPVRRRAIELLSRRNLRAGELVAQLGGSRPGVSQHLRVLRHSGLVIPSRKGTSLVYHLNARAVRCVLEWSLKIVRR